MKSQNQISLFPIGFQIDRVGELEVSYKTKEKTTELTKIKSSHDVADYLRSNWGNQLTYREKFVVLMLNNNNKIIGRATMSEGAITGTMVDNRMLFQTILLSNAVAFIIAHNHPSGSTNPSGADKALTSKIKEAAKILDLKLLDHVILTEDDHFSFADNAII